MTTTDTESIKSSYDAVPYTSHAFPQTSPEQLQAIGHLFGLSPPSPRTARVLELGCAAGGNLIPFVARNPEASALGLDLSSVQIADGLALVEALGLENIDLRQADVGQVDPDTLGRFDYIVCHGVYSWVPPQVQDAILRIAGALLTDDGIAYVSYNAYPGWKTKEVLRDAMLLRSSMAPRPEARLAYARGMVDFLTEMAPQGSLLAGIMESNRSLMATAKDYYLLHEFLEEYNAPCYFRDFLARAQAHGLGYLADAEPATMFVANHGVKIAEPLLKECGGSQVVLEQYLDFLTQRQFRQTLLVPASRTGAIRYHLSTDRLRSLHYAACLPSLDGEVKYGPSPQRHGQSENRFLTLSSGYAKAAAVALTEAWPATLGFEQLLTAMERQLGEAARSAESLQTLELLLEKIVIHGVGQIRMEPVEFVSDASAGPKVARAIRERAAVSQPARVAGYTFNRWHETIMLDPVDRVLLPLLDGQAGRATLVEALAAAVAAGHVVLTFSPPHSHEGRAIIDPEQIALAVNSHVDAFLNRLRTMKVLD